MNPITPRIAAELLAHEGIVLEAYRDSVGIWTWGVGVTNASGHQVHPRYLDKPASLERALEVYVWLLRERYLPAVEKALGDCPLPEHQLGGALSFHYNTGAIGRTAWVRRWMAGDVAGARSGLMEWRHPPEVVARRRRERDLFFDGRWSGDGKALVYQVAKPSYQPVRGRRVEIMPVLERVLK